jgi:hypothetical protein
MHTERLIPAETLEIGYNAQMPTYFVDFSNCLRVGNTMNDVNGIPCICDVILTRKIFKIFDQCNSHVTYILIHFNLGDFSIKDLCMVYLVMISKY